jgi:hypothetical protein
LVVEKRINHWYFTTYGEGYAMLPYHTGDYWDEYYCQSLDKKPLLGIVLEVAVNHANGFYVDKYRTYRVMWLNCPDRERFMMNRQFYGDELRLLSKINYSQEGCGDE